MKSSSEGERYTGIKSFMSSESDLLYDVCFAWYQCDKELKQEIFSWYFPLFSLCRKRLNQPQNVPLIIFCLFGHDSFN